MITLRYRTLVAFFAGFALTVVAGFAVQTWSAEAGDLPGAGDSVFVAIAPCRLFDFRPAPVTVGPRAAPLGPGEIYQQQVVGTVGNCTLPTGITAVAMNVTVLGGTEPSNLVLYPADVATPPTASNLNWLPGQPPTPNKVDVKLSAGGAIKLRNAFGQVSVLADAVGYYTDSGLAEVSSRIGDLQTSLAGVAHASGEQDVALGGPPQSVRDVTLDPPQPGRAIVTASGWFLLGTSGYDHATCSITIGPVAIDSAHEFRVDDAGAVSGVPYVPFSSTRVFTVHDAPSVFRLVCAEQDGDVYVRDTELTAVYVPEEY